MHGAAKGRGGGKWGDGEEGRGGTKRKGKNSQEEEGRVTKGEKSRRDAKEERGERHQERKRGSTDLNSVHEIPRSGPNAVVSPSSWMQLLLPSGRMRCSQLPRKSASEQM